MVSRICLAIIVAMALACGGGGGSSESTPTPTPPPIESKRAVIGDSLSVNIAPYLDADPYAISGGTLETITELVKASDLSAYTEIYVMAGINNISAYRETSDAVLSKYASLLLIIQGKTHAKIFVQSTLPMDDLWVNGEVIKLNEGLKLLCQQMNLTYIDLFPLFYDYATGLIIESLYMDIAHPNKEGCQKWADFLL